MPFDIEVTEDGSFSCRDAATGELYHNIAGAFTEAHKNYAEPAVAAFTPAVLRVLDVCFGLGYNSFALIEHVLSQKLPIDRIEITALENDPSIVAFLPQVLEQPYFTNLQGLLENCLVDRMSINKFGVFSINGEQLQVELTLLRDDLRVRVPQLAEAGARFDLIFHDPFSPKKVPELWTIDLFEIYHKLLSEHGSVLTYSASSAVRGGLQKAGFFVYRTTAVGGKSGGTIASLVKLDEAARAGASPQDAEKLPAQEGDGAPAAVSAPAQIYLLDADEQSLMSGRKGVPYRDPAFKRSSQEILNERQSEQERDFPKVTQ